MSNLILDNISLILLLPLWIFLIIMCGRFFSVYVNKSLIYVLTLLSSFIGAGVCGLSLINYTEPVEFIYPFIKINDLIINFGLQIDKLSLIIALLLFIISFAVQLFSVSYMKDEKKNYKFFAFLNLFNFTMAFLLFSPNLFQFYVFWELVSVVSYLLIGFEYNNEQKSNASKRVFLMNRVGDTALLAGIVLVSYYMFSFAENISFVTLSFEDFNAISTLLMAYTSAPEFYLICGLFILAAAVKSAQFPFYTWLQDAMEAKAPVSALLHSATMVVAGVYLVIRMMPFFTLGSILLKFILLLGILTTLICSILASVETEPKKVLAYSTSSNIGLMFAALGYVNIKIALIYLIAHAFIKSALFILLPRENVMPKWNFVLMCIAVLSLAGLLFSGIGIKELIFNTISVNAILFYLFMFICFINAFYISRLAILIYNQTEFKNNVNILELAAFLILLSGNVFLYMLIINSYSLAEPFAAAIGGLALALLLGKNNALQKFNNTPKLLENLYNKALPYLYDKLTSGLNFIDIQIFSNYKPILCVAGFAVKITNWIENNIMNGSVSLVRDLAKELSKKDKIIQSGNVQTYNAYAFIVLTIIIAFVIIGYMFIIGG